MRRTQGELADLTRDLVDFVETLADRGETVFGEDRLPAPPRLEIPQVSEAAAAPATRPPPPAAPDHAPGAELPRGLKDLTTEAASCTRCALSELRTTVVFGGGSGTSGLMLIGEGPGQNEDRTGIPFVGRAGKLLDRIIAAAGFQRETLYITNIVKCRPPRNRDPRPDEVQSCRPYLNRQVEALAPKLIIAVGRPAAQSLLRTERPLTRLRGRVHSLGGIPLVVTYHPAYLLRSPAQKALAWEDWRRIRDLVLRLRADGTAPVDGEVVPL